jgi:hypothetical protein
MIVCCQVERFVCWADHSSGSWSIDNEEALAY